MQSNHRLLGTSRNGTNTETELKTKAHIGVIGLVEGAVYCLTSLSIRGASVVTKFYCNLLAASCEDDAVQIYRALEEQIIKVKERNIKEIIKEKKRNIKESKRL